MPQQTPHKRRPVVLVHGIFSDILKHNERVVWPCKTPLHIGQLKSNVLDFMAGSTNSQTLEYESFTGRHIDPEIGVKAIDRLVKTNVLYKLGVHIVDCFDVLIDALCALGYVKDENLVAYTYDFRQSPLHPRQQTRFRAFLERFKGNTPIIIAHSMGVQVVKLFMHANPDWNSYFRHFIAVSGAFDGSTATEMILTLVGYDLGVSLLDGCTRFLWANSGMALTLTPGSELFDVAPCIYARIVEMQEYEQVSEHLDDHELWNQVRIIKDKDCFLIALLRRIKASPELVRYKARYWIRRFKQFLGSMIEIPQIDNVNAEMYVEPCSYPRRQEDFFKVDYHAYKVPAGSAKVVQITQWGPDANGFTYSPRVQMLPEDVEYASDYFSRDLSADKTALKVAQHMMLRAELPADLPFVCATRMSLFDFYDNIYPEYSIERFVFASLKPLYELHARTRCQTIQHYEALYFANFAGAELPTPMFVHFAPVRRFADLRFVMPEIVFGYGDGSILLTSYLSDGFQAVKRRVYAGVKHSNMIREERVVRDIIATVSEMQ